jgi:threonine aldolase
MEIIDYRSDTVTKPSKEMLEAMVQAEVGDDVFGEDPTVGKLESKLAELFGMEAGIFVPSGTMGNQLALHVHSKPGDEVICDFQSHIYQYESGGLAANSGLQVKLIQGDRGRISAAQVEAAINADFDWLSRSRIVSIENTCNKAGGSVYELSAIQKISELAKQKGLKLHLDGARIFNALVAKNQHPADLKGLFDSISICLSKGLGAPVGSVLVGNSAFIKEARRVRKRWGGGMRQAGYLAAAGLYALEKNVTRLSVDHQKAKQLAQTIEQLPFVKEVLPVETNIVLFHVNHPDQVGSFLKQLENNGIKAIQFGPTAIRMITHLDISDNQLEKTLAVLKSIRA